MRKNREAAKGDAAQRQYCERLVRVAFPLRVWIGNTPYSREDLQAALASVPQFKREVARQFDGDPDNSGEEDLVATAFPPTVEVEGVRYSPAELFESLLDSPQLQKSVAEKYHFASDELYWERLVEVAFQKSRKDKHQGVRICFVRYRDKDALRRALQEGSQNFRERVGIACGFPRSKWLLELYCKRLVEIALPAQISIESKQYNKEGLRKALEEDYEVCHKIGITYQNSADPSKQDELVERIFPSGIAIADRQYSREELEADLPSSPKLQQKLASATYFTPSKWLVEQEMQASGAWNGDSSAGDIYKLVAKRRPLGVCFSGGGIRSATFNLGVLQGFAQLGLLPCIDYLSSVSGGGYIHEFLAGWILQKESQSKVIGELIPQAEPGCLPRAPEPIEWLKRFSNYLTPRRGIFSTDTWTAVAIWLRNTVLNQMPIVMAFACLFFLVHLLEPRPIEGWHPGLRHGAVLGFAGWWISGLVFSLYAIASVCILGRNLHLQERRIATGEGSIGQLLSNGAVVKWIILPWFLCSLWMSYWVQMPSAHKALPFWLPMVLFSVLILAIVEVVIFAGGAIRAHRALFPEGGWWSAGWAAIGYASGGLLAAGVAVAVGWASMEATRWGSSALSSWVHATFGAKNGVAALVIDAWRIRLAVLPGLLLSVPYVAIELTLGLLGRAYWGMRREWLARLRAWSMLYALLWAALIGWVLLGPYVGYYIHYKGLAWTWSTLLAFLLSHGAIVFSGWSSKSDGKPTQAGLLGLKPMDLLAFVAAPVAIATLLLGLSLAASLAVDKAAKLTQHAVCVRATSSTAACGWDQLGATIPSSRQFTAADAICLLSCLVVAWLLGWRIDLNEFSMHTFYRNRLSRCYLGATIPGRRQADPFSGFDDRGSVKTDGGRIRQNPPLVSDLLPLGYSRATGQEGHYDGPFPIFCATLNLTTGGDLATQERKGVGFAFTPLHSGYSVPWTDGEPDNDVSYNGYVPTEEYAYRNGGVHLDTAVAISGAALNPNQGYNSNPTLAFLMTFFNVRLGWWISNTRKMDTWPATNGRSTPSFALLHLFKELFGMVGDGAKYVNLSDGGHFENMGLYELVRRRCRYIIVCDAEADPDMKFEGMGGAITKCRADFGAEIDLDLRPLRPQGETGNSKAHCVVGTIRYAPPPGSKSKANVATACECIEDDSEDDYTGVIVYMKSSLVGDEPADLLTHQLKCSAFPQDSTANQWFTETLFEAYRRLGHHIAMTTLRPALPPRETRVAGAQSIPELFDRMYAIWYPRTPDMENHLQDHLDQYEAILKELREHNELTGLKERLIDSRRTSALEKRRNPKDISGPADLPFVRWTAPSDVPGSGEYATQFSSSLLNFMYTVYTNLQLAFPDNRVSPHAEWWICMFRRWCRVSLVQDTWAEHGQLYPEEFRLFAIRELGLPEC